MPIYEYACKRCGAVSEYIERHGQWRLLPRKCKACGSRRTKRIPSRFASTVSRTRTETLNEIKHLGPVEVVPGRDPALHRGTPPGGCPFALAGQDKGKGTGPAGAG